MVRGGKFYANQGYGDDAGQLTMRRGTDTLGFMRKWCLKFLSQLFRPVVVGPGTGDPYPQYGEDIQALARN